MIDRLVEASCQGALGFVMVWVIVRALPRLSADWRSWLWRLVCVKFAVALVLSVPIVVERPAPVVSPSPASVTVWPELSSQTTATPAKPTIAEAAAPAPTPIDPLTVVTAIWALGVVLLTLRHGLAWRRLAIIVRDTAPASPEAHECLKLLKAKARVRRRVGLRGTEWLGVPAVFGAVRPTILIPRDADANPSALESALAHELAHVKRRDLPWALATEVVKACFWFHPLIWLAVREANAEAEIAADRTAREWLTQSPREYARHLLSWLEGPRTSTPGLLFATHHLDRRLKAMTLTRYRRSSAAFVGLALAAPVVLCLIPARLQAKYLVPQALLPREPQTIVEIPASSAPVHPLIPPSMNANDAWRAASKAGLVNTRNASSLRQLRRLQKSGPEGRVYGADLEGGGRVELLGITHLEPGKSRSWSADGTPLKNLLPFTPTSGIPFRSIIVNDGTTKRDTPTNFAFGRQALLRIRGRDTGMSGTFSDIGTPFGSLSNSMPLPGRLNGDRLMVVEQGFTDSATEKDLTITYYQEPQLLGTVAVKNGRIESKKGLPAADIAPYADFTLADPKFGRFFKAGPNSFVISVDKPQKGGLDSLRLSIVLRSGKTASAYSAGSLITRKDGSENTKRAHWMLIDLDPKQIASIKFMLTKREQVVFKNVQLQPHG